MPRAARIVVPHCPHHIIQRGHNRQPVFVADEDYGYYLDNLRDRKKELGCRVYAYCLMTNHVHLLIDPGEREENLGLLMKRGGGRQTRYVNKLEKRSGTLWEGRYKSCPVSRNYYLLACSRYIEMNPVRAGMVGAPGDYRWSSFGAKVEAANPGSAELGTDMRSVPSGVRPDWLDFDLHYLSLGTTAAERADKYRRWVKDTTPEWEMKLIRESLNRCQVTGDQKFVAEVEARIGRRLEVRRPGRPRKEL